MRAISTVLALLVALFLAGCTSNETFRYRMIVEVETPEGLRTGSSVREVEIWERMDDAIIGNKVGGKVRGEAVAVDLPNGQTLYMLLGDARWHAHRAIKTPPPGPGHHLLGVKRARWMIKNKAKGELPRGRYPRMVIFQDDDDPTSVMEADPDDLEATLGEGYALKRVGIEITDERVTRQMRARIPWLQPVAQAGGGLIPMVKNNTDGRFEPAVGYDAALVGVAASDFSTEVYETNE